MNIDDHLRKIWDSGSSISVGILMFPGMEVLDFAGPFEVFSVAARLSSRQSPFLPPAFEVRTICSRSSPVSARHGLVVVPDYGFADAPVVNILIIPGGIVTQPLNDSETLEWLRESSGNATLIASICTGAYLLARIGLLDGLCATTHWEDLDDFRASFPKVGVVPHVPFVDEGAVITSAGISAGISMSLHLISRILGQEMALRTAKQMEYNWTV